MIRIHLVDGSHVDTNEYDIGRATADVTAGVDLELSIPQRIAGLAEPMPSTLIGAAQVDRIEALS
ncbi:hypothetical protein AMIS_20190 [Actinoplanes missouriensis 431]|uniref:Uncharacterized protein n=1 Tax=Actinoplanes missouriensis (strain ATCC 14538 / DSM 43046 / CBS 188.64 / JCM 3121 / NBRC 102363 / NCIMB 12654 / NRRL B-3342 / UNCC 431) TaxID=512565 RepID=I0H2K2_ACTM4|nr:hypothetical protein [Actinoplanes missouriensis]BAL87239.1 hypothetical protein AMIS_20190 [Actinoplanes missouriensis 431]